MSPEQARGRLVDRRSDIWSFGCVLYEMMSGKKCFSGDTPLDVLAAVIRAEPDWSALPRGVPAAARALLLRTLRKDPARRLQHIGEARVRLEEIGEGFEEERIVIETGEDGLPAGAGVGWAAALLMIGGFTGAILQGAFFGAITVPVGASDPVSASISLPPGQTIVTQPYTSLAVSPDGRFLAYAAGTSEGHQLYLRRLDRFEPEPILGSEGASSPFFSPNSQWLGYFSGDGKLMKVPTAGGPAEEICEVPVGNTGAAWGADDRIVFGTLATGSGLMVVAADGGTASPLTRPEPDRNEIEHNWPTLLPDGDTLIFTSRDAQSRVSVHALSLFSRERQLLLDGVADVRYFGNGYLLYSQAGEVSAVAFDAETLSLAGEPIRLLQGVFSAEYQRSSFAASRAGTLVFLPGDAMEAQQRLAWVDRNGRAAPLPFVEPGRFGHPRLSPGETRLAVDVPSDGSIKVFDLLRGSVTPLRMPGRIAMPVWNSTGTRILVSAQVDGPAALYSMRADGVGEPQEVLLRESALWPRSWNAVGIAYYELNPNPDAGGRDIWLYEGEGTEPRPLVATPHNERSPMLSPDGCFLAYVSNEPGRDEVYVRAIDDDRRWPVSIDGGREPVWSRSGDELYYRSGDAMMFVSVQPGDSPSFGVPEVLFEGRFAYDRNASNQYYDVSSDGRFLMILPDENQQSRNHLHAVLNFDRMLEAAIEQAEDQQ